MLSKEGRMKAKGGARIPWNQIAILATCRFAEPVVLTSVYPYLPEMIESFGVPTKSIALWVGLVTACFSFCQFLSGIPWGRWSDRNGRKPAILLGVSATALTSIGFGMSKSLWMAIMFRCLSGLGNGVVGISRTMVAEMVPQKELQPRAFATIPLMWTIGSVIGPVLGGSLANPAKKFPDSFGKIPFFTTFPYSLPNFTASLVFIIGISTGFFFLRETLETVKHRRDVGVEIGDKLKRCASGRRHRKNISIDESIDGISLLDSDGGFSHSTALPTKRVSYREILTKQSVIVTVAYSLLAFHNVACDQLLPVLMHTPVQDPQEVHSRKNFLKFAGGLGLDTQEIGTFFTANAIIGMILQFGAFPPIVNKLGALNCFKLCGVLYPIIYAIMPFALLLETHNQKKIGLFSLMVFKAFGSIFSFPCSTILLTNSATSLRGLGTLNGVATSTSALGRAIGPAIMGAFFTLGLRVGFLVIPWWVLTFFSVLACIPIFFIVEGDGPHAAMMEAIGQHDEEEEEAEINVEDALNRSEQGVKEGLAEPREFSLVLDSDSEEDDYDGRRSNEEAGLLRKKSAKKASKKSA